MLNLRSLFRVWLLLTVAPVTGFSATDVCAQVKLVVEQDLWVTRKAYTATLGIENADSAVAINQVAVQITITDLLGQPANELFRFRAPELTGLEAVDGTGVVSPSSSAQARWLIVPTAAAAANGVTQYKVGGRLSYTYAGEVVVIPLSPITISVYPEPSLTLKYFHQRDVFSDDPHTFNIEPSEPYTLAVLIKNSGVGAARNVSITSAQPKIVENEKGLLIDFKIIASEITDYIEDDEVITELTPSLTVNFGNIEPGATKVGRWLLTSSLQGLFIDYSATFEHVNDLGDPSLSLLQNVEIHELIRQVADPSGRPVYLVNDVEDDRDFPDTVHLVDGTTAPVSVIESSSLDGSPSLGRPVVTLTAALPAGWAYLRVPDPANGRFRLTRVQRPDGSDLALGTGAWVTDRTFIGLGRRPIRENILHLADLDSPGRYTLTYAALPGSDITPPVSAVDELPAASYAQIPVTWSGTDAGGLANFDVYVSENGGTYTLWQAAMPPGGVLFAGEAGKTYAFYTRARDAAGNVEAAPTMPDATTTVSLANRSPVLDAIPAQTIQEGEVLTLQLHATDLDAGNTLTFRLGLNAPPGMLLSPQTGELTWQTTLDHGGHIYSVTVEAWDNGEPRLKATRAFQVRILDRSASQIAAAPLGGYNLASKPHTLTVTPSGDGPFTYQWSLNGTPLPGETSASLYFPSFSVSNNGRYTVTITGPFGSTTSAVARLSAGLPWAEVPATLTRKVGGTVSLDLRTGLGLTPGITWASSKLPAGLKLDAKTGLLTGRITAKPGTYTITLWAVSGKTKGEVRTLTLTVEPYPAALVGSFEGLLTSTGSGLPAGKLTLKVASGGGFTGTLVTPLPKTYALKGNLLVNDAGTAALVTLPVAPYSLSVALATEGTGPLTATLTQGPTPRGNLGDGVRLAAFTGKGAGIAPWRAAAYTLALGDPRANLDLTLPLRALPVGAGYATGSIDAKGLLKLTGKLADGRAFTLSLPADADAGYRCYVQPYGTTSVTTADNYLAGWLRLVRWSEAPVRYRTLPTEGGDVYWHKPAAAKDANHRSGFGPVALTARLATWIAPNAKAVSPLPATLATALALPTAPLDLPLVFSGGGLSEAQLTVLPDFLRLDAKGGLSAVPVPPAKTWSFTLAQGTGKFTGSFVVSDPGVTPTAKATTRKVSFEGVLLQLPSNEAEGRIGEGFYLAPTKVKGGAGESGAIQILRVP